MNLIDYGRILIRRGWIILLLAILAAGGAYFLSTRQQPIYRAIQKVLIQPARSDFGLTESSRLLLNNLRSYLDSSYIAASVIETLQLDMTPTALLDNVDVVANQLDISIEISVDLPEASTANDVAREWGQELVRLREEENQKVRREEGVNARLQDNPSVGLFAPQPGINALAGGILGFLLGCIIVFILEYLESSVVRRRDDLERALDMTVLAAIPDTEA